MICQKKPLRYSSCKILQGEGKNKLAENLLWIKENQRERRITKANENRIGNKRKKEKKKKEEAVDRVGSSWRLKSNDVNLGEAGIRSFGVGLRSEERL